MCKWEWPFVFIISRTNKYPLRTEAMVFKNPFFFFAVIIFYIILLSQVEAETPGVWEGTWILMPRVKWLADSAGWWHCLWKQRGKKTVQCLHYEDVKYWSGLVLPLLPHSNFKGYCYYGLHSFWLQSSAFGTVVMRADVSPWRFEGKCCLSRGKKKKKTPSH